MCEKTKEQDVPQIIFDIEEMASLSDPIGEQFRKAVETHGHTKARLLVCMAVSDFILGTTCEEHMYREQYQINYGINELIKHVTCA